MEKSNPNEWRRKLPVEAASGLNDWLGAGMFKGYVE